MSDLMRTPIVGQSREASFVSPIDPALSELAAVEGYPFDKAKDRAMLAEFHERRPRVALQHEIAKWAERKREGLRDPRRALAGWLKKALDMSDSDFSSLE